VSITQKTSPDIIERNDVLSNIRELYRDNNTEITEVNADGDRQILDEITEMTIYVHHANPEA